MPRLVIPARTAPVSVPIAGVALIVIDDAIGKLIHPAKMDPA
jgi:hypothetical protein